MTNYMVESQAYLALDDLARGYRERAEKAEREVERLRGAIVAWDDAKARYARNEAGSGDDLGEAYEVLRGIAGEAK